MDLIFSRQQSTPPDLSLILLDWDCRESYHALDYLAAQGVPRDRYEVIWIEFYQKRAPQLRGMIDRALAAGTAPPIDQYVLLDFPKTVCYHKHLMYNVGIAMARGAVVCIPDSDAMVRPDFVAAMLGAFAEDEGLVLHLDELRSSKGRFYPFDHPTIEDVERAPATNARDGRPAGLLDRKDMLHSRNYGACMAARRADLIAIGGADMHEDYLGYICGPYDMTFRLLNAGLRLRWHPTQWLYHTWHPGEAGDNNYCGPHDGRNMARAAMASRLTGRVMPLVEHPVVTRLRGGWRPAGPGAPEEALVAFAETQAASAAAWEFARLKTVERKYMHYGQHELKLLEKA